MSRPNLPARPAYESLIESLKSQRRAVGRQLAGQLVLHPKFVDALLEEHATYEAKRDAVPPAAVPQSPSYDALLIIAQAVQGALLRAGVDECDDPGEAIDVMRERYERRIAELKAPPAAEPRNG